MSNSNQIDLWFATKRIICEGCGAYKTPHEACYPTKQIASVLPEKNITSVSNAVMADPAVIMACAECNNGRDQLLDND